MAPIHSNPVFLVSSAGRRVELIRTLRQGFRDFTPIIIAVDASPLVPTKYEADQFFEVPRLDSPRFHDALAEIVEDESVDFIIPTIDTELAIFARLREEKFFPQTDILVSSVQAVALAQDKLAFAEFLKDCQLPFVRSRSLEGGLGDWDAFPAFIKPQRGSSASGCRIVESKSDFLAQDFISDLIIQPLRSGSEYTVDFAVGSNGKLLGFSIRERLSVRAGEVVVSVTREIEAIETLLNNFIDVCPGLYGVANLQVVAWEGGYEILELNGRVGGGYPLSFFAGCNLFSALVSGVDAETLRTREGFLMLRHDNSVIIPPEGI